LKKTPKKVVIVGSAFPLRGGLASFNERLARAFQDKGDEVIIYTFSLQYPGFLFPGKTQYSSDPAPADLNITVNVNSINPFNWLQVGRQIRKLRPDLLIAKFWLPFMGPCLGTILRRGKSKKTKVVSVIDNIIPHEKRPGDFILAKYFVKAVDAFVVMSRSVEKDMQQFTDQQPVRYIPHPIYDNYGAITPKMVALQHLGLDPTFSYLLFFGFIRDYKGLDLLLEAMADDRIRALPLKLMVAGEYYANEEKYLKLIQELDIDDQLELRTDFIPNSEVRYYFGAADLVVQPYKSATQSGISQLAYHFEKPMVVTKVGGLPEIVEDGVAGYVVEVDKNKIVEAILDFYQHKKEKKLMEGVREAKSRFSWDNLIEGIYELTKL
jgi:D-inositol-3-phosphate glycosyltransferase